MTKRRNYRPAAAGYATGRRRARARYDAWRRRRLYRTDGPNVVVHIGDPVNEAYVLDPRLTDMPAGPMAVMTRPQDWAEPARSILWPELYGAALAASINRPPDPRAHIRVTGL